jgi:hypothetical protein
MSFSHPQKWRVPTWSWTSVDGGISTRGNAWHRKDDFCGHVVPFIDVLSVVCVSKSTGELFSGYAVLRGSFIAARYRYKPHY